MKKIMEEKTKELLRMYVSADSLCEKLKEPMRCGGHVFATDNVSAIIIQRDLVTDSGKYRDFSNKKGFKEKLFMGMNCNLRVTLGDIDDCLSKVPRIAEVIMEGEYVECSECNGTGEVEWEYRSMDGKHYNKDLDCPVCDGSGYSSKPQEVKTGAFVMDGDSIVLVRKVKIMASVLAKIRETMALLGLQEARFTTLDKKEVCEIRYTDGIRGIFCPINPYACNKEIVELKLKGI